MHEENIRFSANSHEEALNYQYKLEVSCVQSGA